MAAVAELLPLILIAALVMGLALGGMAIGVMLRGKQIAGSCGGLANANLPGHDAASPCVACGVSPETCDRPGAEQVRAAVREREDGQAPEIVR